MSMPVPDVAIVIVNWNTRALLLACLERLPAATAGIRAETWVVDNGSSDDSVAAMRAQFPEVRVIANDDNKGFAAANNQAIHASASRHVLLLNSDTLPHPGSISALVDFLDTNPKVGVVGPKLLNGDGSLQPSWAMFPTVWSVLIGKNIPLRRRYSAAAPARVYSTDWVCGACLLIRRTAVDRVGTLDERYFMYSEETDWCYQVKKCGWEICYYADADVVHLGGQSSRKASTRMKAELYTSKLRFFFKNYSRQRAWMLGLLLDLGFLGKIVAGAALCSVSERHRARGRWVLMDSTAVRQAIQITLYADM